MRALNVAAASAVLVLFAGCALIKDPRQKDEPEAQPQSDGTTLAGTWTRQGESARVFDVTDDGSTVHGELRDAKGAGFESYSFDLKKKSGNALAGKATFVLSDIPGKPFEATWDATVEGTLITCKQEEFGISDTNEVIDRTTVTHKYDVAGAAPPPPPEMPAMDMSAYVPVLPTYKHLLADGIAVGHWVDVEVETAGMKMLTRTSVVGEAGDEWILEIDNQMNQKDLLLAVFVNKETGLATKAFVGNRGKDGKAKDVPAPPPEQTGDAPTPTEEEVTVPAGTYAAHRVDVMVQGSTYSTWSGAPGSDAEGVLLKSANPQGTDELKSLEGVSHDVSGTSFDARRLVYTSGQEMVMAKGDAKPHLNQVMLLMKTAQMTMGLKAQGDDATPAFNYPRK